MLLKKLFVVLFLISTSINILIANETIDINIALGIDNYRNSEYIGTIYFMNKILSNSDNTGLYTEALFWKSKSYFKLGYYSDAIKTLDIFFKKGTNKTLYYEDARFLYCKTYYMLGNYKDALLLFKQFESNSAFTYYTNSVLFWLGECHLKTSNYKQALEYYKKYILANGESKLVQQRVDSLTGFIAAKEGKTQEIDEVIKKSAWFSDYIYLEQKDKTSSEYSDFINSFNNRDEFFDWLEKNKRNFTKNSNKNSDLELELELLEDTKLEVNVLDELELLLIKSLGVGN